MQENLVDNDSQSFEKFNIDLNEIRSFKPNKCPIDLKINNYRKLDFQIGDVSKEDFDKSKIACLIENSLIGIFISFIFFFSFYVLLITYILSSDNKILLFLIAIYILGNFVQIIVIPEPINFKSKSEFENEINKILNSYLEIKLINKKKKKQATFPKKYTIDITGEINIPKEFNYVKIKGVQFYSKRKELKKYSNDFQAVYGSVKLDYKWRYNNEDIVLPSTAFAINDNCDSYSINCYTTLFCLFLIQWINALYYKYSRCKKCIELIPAKLITDNLINSPTKFNVYGNKYEITSYINNPNYNNEEFDNDLAQYKKEKKEKEERDRISREKKEEEERKRKENTTLLSSFKNGDNYTIKVKKVYDSVYLRFDAYTPYGHSYFKSRLGIYNKNIHERIENISKLTVYYPNGYDIKIEVQRGLYSYTVSIGDEYTENFEYRHLRR